MTQLIDLDFIPFERQFLLHLAELFNHERGTCLLYSGSQQETAHVSFLCLYPTEMICIKEKERKKSGLFSSFCMTSTKKNPWDALQELLTFSSSALPYPEWVGFLSYEMGAHSDRDKLLHYYRGQEPDAYFVRPAIIIKVEHQHAKGTVLLTDQVDALEGVARNWAKRLACREEWQALIENFRKLKAFPTASSAIEKIELDETRASYLSKIADAQDLIKAGDIYQVNLSQQFTGKLTHPLTHENSQNAYRVFRELATYNPAPFSAYLHLEGIKIVSSSPERFLKMQAGHLETRPIKGTWARGKTVREDEENRHYLLHSEKNKAELLMITDLMRNDLGKVSIPGSVITPQIWQCEAYTNVFHLVSTVIARALPHLKPLDIIRACFPGGSITGCPKLSAMEIIASLEKRRRGIYTGCIGYFTSTGDFDFNIAIRTLVYAKDKVTIQVGGAIVADSNPSQEYEETLQKADSIFKVLGIDASLLKVMR